MPIIKKIFKKDSFVMMWITILGYHFIIRFLKLKICLSNNQSEICIERWLFKGVLCDTDLRDYHGEGYGSINLDISLLVFQNNISSVWFNLYC